MIKKKSVSKYTVLAVSVLCVLLAGVFVANAGLSLKEIIGKYAGEKLADNLTAEVMSDEVEDLTVGVFSGPDIYEAIRFHDGYTGASLSIPLRYQSATSTAQTDLVLGTHLFAEDVFLYNWGWAITEQNDDSGFGDFGIGTTTLTSGSRFSPGVSSLTNTTTRTMVANSKIATSTDNVSFDVWGYADRVYVGTGVEGNKATTTIGSFFDTLAGGGTTRRSTTSPLFIPAGTALVISASGVGGATSSDALTTGDAINFKGMFYGDVIYQK